jgi:Ca-activated chloride channel family protein
MNDDRFPTITIIPLRPAVPAGCESTLDVLLRIVSPPAARSERRRLLNLGIVLDRSGSMGGEKIRYARQAVDFAVRHMDEEDQVSLTTFDDRIERPLPTTSAGRALAGLRELLDSIEPRSSTALHDAWVQGGLEVSRHQHPERVNRVLLISDGLANVGETNPDALVARAAELFDRGVSTSTIGVGRDFNEDLMIRMAVSGGGAGWFVESPEDFVRIFSAELSGLMNQFGQGGRLRLEPGRGVVIQELLNDLDRREEGWGLGPLVTNQPLSLVVRLRVRGGEIGQPVELFRAIASCEVPGRGRVETSASGSVTSDEPGRVAQLPADSEVASQIQLLMAARARREAVRQLDLGDTFGSRKSLRVAYDSLMSYLSSAEDPSASADAAELDQLLAMTTDPQKKEMLRKMALYQDYYRRYRSSRKPGSEPGATK